MRKRFAGATTWPLVAALGLAVVLALLAAIFFRQPGRPSIPPPPKHVGKADARRQQSQDDRRLELDQRTLAGKALPVGGEADRGARTIATLQDSAGMTVEFEIKPHEVPFDATALRARSMDASGQADLSHDLADGAYRWRARLRAGSQEQAWSVFEPNEAVHFIIVSAPPPSKPRNQPADADGPGSATSIASGGGEGMRRPNRSEVKEPPALWSLLLPVALVLVALGVAVALFEWRKKRMKTRAP